MKASRRGAGGPGDAGDRVGAQRGPLLSFDEHLEQVADGVADAIVIADKDCKVRYANAAAQRLFDMSQERLLGLRCDDPALCLAASDGTPLATEALPCHQALVSGEGRSAVELTLGRPDGGRIAVLASASPLKDKDGKVVGVVNSYTDITERQHAEEVLRENDERNRSLLRTYAALGQANSYRATLDAIRPEIGEKIGYESVWLQMVSSASAELLTLHVGGTVEESLRKLMELNPGMVRRVGDDEFLALPLTDDPYLSRVIDARRIDVLEDAQTDPITNMPANKDLVKASGNRTIVAVPLMLAEEKLGCLSMGTFFDEGPLVPTPEQLDWLAALANHVAVAMDRVRFLVRRQEDEAALRERDEHSQSLLRLYGRLGRANTYTAIRDAMMAEVPGVLGYRGVGLLVMDKDRGAFRLLQAEGSAQQSAEDILGMGPRFHGADEDEEFLILPIEGDPMLEEIAEGSHIVVVEDARTDPRTDKKIVEASGNRTVVNVPLVLAGENLGTMATGTFWDEGVRPPTPAQLEFLQAAANHIAVAMDRVRFLGEIRVAEAALRERDEHNQSLLRLYEGLGRANTYTAILGALLEEVPGTIGHSNVALYVYDKEKNRALMVQAEGAPIEGAREKLMAYDDRFSDSVEGDSFLVLPIAGDAYLEEVIEATHIVVVEDARTDPRTNKEVVAVTDTRTVVNVPLMFAGERLGVFSTGTYGDEGVRPPTPAQLDYLAAAANHVAVAMDRVRFLRRLSESAAALRESEERYRRFVETSIEGVWAIDEELKTAFVSNQMAKMLGFSAKDLVGRAATELMFDEDKAEFEEKMRRRRNGRGETYEMRFRRADGSVVWLQLSATPILDDSGRFEGSFAMATDITKRKHAEEELEKLVGRLRELLEGVVDALSSTTSQRDPYTAMHQERVARLSCAIAKEMQLPAEFVEGLKTAALLHDIGKIAVPSEILTKPGKLTDLEMGIVRSHAGIGYRLLEHVAFGQPVAQAVLQHHERLDGSGYPSGLVGDEILLESRILGVADVVEAMSSYRPYRPALGMDAALAEVEECAGTKYDRDVVAACAKVVRSAAVVL